MKTPIEALIDRIKQSPSETLTKFNVLYALEQMLPVEQDHLEAMADHYVNTFRPMGIRAISGKELFEKRYNKS